MSEGPRRGEVVALVFPGDLATRTGGYTYDRRAFAGLEGLGWAVRHVSLPDRFPFPDEGALAAADATLAGLPDGSRAVVDGLAFGAMPGVVARHAARLDLTALVHHPLGLETGLSAEDAALLLGSEREALRSARRVIVTSPLTARTLVADLGVPADRIAVALPGVDPAPVAEVGDVLRRLLCVGTLTPRKGHLVLLEALATSRDLDWRLVCAGSVDRDPGTADAVRGALDRLGLADRVRLAGELDGAGLAAAYADAGLLVSASFYEGYGMALTEALARACRWWPPQAGRARTVPAGAGLLVPSATRRPWSPRSAGRWPSPASIADCAKSAPGTRAACRAGRHRRRDRARAAAEAPPA
jgi:glycosyltransferase involved in cell wall biosynthesis